MPTYSFFRKKILIFFNWHTLKEILFISFDENGRAVLGTKTPTSTIKIWAFFCNESTGPMVNMSNIPGFQVLLDDFLMPFYLDMELESSSKPSLMFPHSVDEANIVCEWSASHGIPLTFLPPKSVDLSLFNIIWPKFIKSSTQIHISSKQRLWEEVADWFDASTRYKGLWSSASRSMSIRLGKVIQSNGNFISF